MNNHGLTKDEMERLLPDFLFNRLNEKERNLFEANIDKYPELKLELDNAKSVFETADLMSFDRLITGQSNDISVKVNNRIASKESKSRNFLASRFSKYSIPLAAAIALGYFGITSDFFVSDGKTELITQADMEVLFDSEVAEDDIPIIYNEKPFSLSSNDIMIDDAQKNEQLNEIIDEWVFEVQEEEDLDELIDYNLEELIETEDELQLLYGES